MESNLYLMDMDTALGEIRSQTGVDKFELVGMDACLMGQLEVFSALAPHARYAVASQETEPALGWAYTSFLDTLTRNPDGPAPIWGAPSSTVTSWRTSASWMTRPAPK